MVKGRELYASGLWVAFTLTASAAQTARNVMQRELTGALGALGASQVRFLFGLPFAILFFIGLRLATGVAAPTITPAAAGFIVVGALAQIGGTALMLAAMRAAQLRRRRRLHQDRGGAGGALRAAVPRRDADGRR